MATRKTPTGSRAKTMRVRGTLMPQRMMKEPSSMIREMNRSSGIRVAKAFTNKEGEIRKFEHRNGEFVEARSNAYKVMGQFSASTNFFTAARGAHQGQGFAAADVQVDVPQDLGVVVVGEAHPLKGDVAPGLLVAHGDGAGVVSLLRLVHDLAKALEAGDPLLELLDKGQQPADGV